MRLRLYLAPTLVTSIAIAYSLIEHGIDFYNQSRFFNIKSNISTGETQVFHIDLPADSDDVIGISTDAFMFVSGNIWACSNISDGTIYSYETVENGFLVVNNLCISFSVSPNTSASHGYNQKFYFENGYVGALIPTATNLLQNHVYITVEAPLNGSLLVYWIYDLVVSLDGMVYQWDNRLWAHLIDTTETTALVVSDKLTIDQESNLSSLRISNAGAPLEIHDSFMPEFSLHVFSYNELQKLNAYSRSWRVMHSWPAVIKLSEITTSFQHRNGDLEQQFYIEGLNASTRYVAYMTATYNKATIQDVYGRYVFAPLYFTTQPDLACQILYNLEFCTNVAYAVPSSRGLTRTELAAKYDNQAKLVYGNFSKALQQISCDVNQEAIFSPVRTCNDCAISYKNWLCSVIIPRCSSIRQDEYRKRHLNELRSDFINTEIQPWLPYYEVLPCIENCERLVRDCPAKFGFKCPRHGNLNQESYAIYNASLGYPVCNWVGEMVTSGSKNMRPHFLYSLHVYIVLTLVIP